MQPSGGSYCRRQMGAMCTFTCGCTALSILTLTHPLFISHYVDGTSLVAGSLFRFTMTIIGCGWAIVEVPIVTAQQQQLLSMISLLELWIQSHEIIVPTNRLVRYNMSCSTMSFTGLVLLLSVHCCFNSSGLRHMSYTTTRICDLRFR